MQSEKPLARALTDKNVDGLDVARDPLCFDASKCHSGKENAQL